MVIRPVLKQPRESVVKLLERTGRWVSFSSEDPGSRRGRKRMAQGWK